MEIQLPDSSDLASWLWTGSDAKHFVLVPGANCRPAKVVFDCVLQNVSRECITIDPCPPFLRPYSRYSGQMSLFEVIPGIGLGCLMIQGGVTVTHRSKLAPTDAGNFMHAKDALLDIMLAVESFANAGAVQPIWAPPSTDEFFGIRDTHGPICPNA